MTVDRVYTSVYTKYDEMFAESEEARNISDADYEALIVSYASGAVQERSILKGIVERIEKDYVAVNIGGKVEGRVMIDEFREDEDSPIEVAEGDCISVYVERLEGINHRQRGRTATPFSILSHKKAILRERWSELEACFEAKQIVRGKMAYRVKGGVYVYLNGIPAFLPGSQIDIKHVKDISHLLGEEHDFLIISMKKSSGNIVLSRKAVLAVGHGAKVQQFVEQLSVGSILDGVVKNIANYGTFITFSNAEGEALIDGLLHITDTSWTRISHPSEDPAIKPGEPIKVMVIGIDPKTRKLSLGRKQLMESPWSKAPSIFVVGSVYRGYITSMENYGLFVKLSCAKTGVNVEGLVHISELSWKDTRVRRADILRDYRIGQEVMVKVLGYEGNDPNHQRMSLSIRQVDEMNPWKEFADKYPIGSVVNGNLLAIKGNVATFDRVFGDVSIKISSSHFLPEHLKGNRIVMNRDDAISAVVLSINIDLQKIYTSVRHISDPEKFFQDMRSLKVGDKIDRCLIIEVDNHVVSLEIGDNNIPAYIVLPQNAKPGLLGYFVSDTKDNLVVDEIDVETGVILLKEDGVEDISVNEDFEDATE